MNQTVLLPPRKSSLIDYLLLGTSGFPILALALYLLVPLAQVRIATWMETGAWFFRKDPVAAAALYEKALAPKMLFPGRDFPTAAHRLGVMFRDGRGVTQDLVRARALLKRGAEYDHPPAQNDLYVLLSEQGQSDEWAEALAWLRRSANAGNATALCNLGALHLRGVPGVPQDPVEARSMYERANKENDIVCAHNLARALEEGWGGGADPTRAFGLYQRAADVGDSEAMGALGDMLISGRGVAKNVDEGKKWLRRGGWLKDLANHGDSAAGFELASELYRSGFENHPDERTKNAFEYLSNAAVRGHAESMLLLAKFYAQGIGVDRNAALAHSWYERASAAGEADATIWLIEQATKSASLHARLSEMVAGLEQAAKRGNAKAQVNLGRMYRDGVGVSENKVEAYAWLILAAGMHADNVDANTERMALEERLSNDELTKAQARARGIRLAIARDSIKK